MIQRPDLRWLPIRPLGEATERSQILLPRPTAGALIPYADEVDIAVLEWIASQARSARQFTHSIM